MSVTIGKVYQQVLLLTNDDRNVELTPEKFNLLAEKVQMEIFEKTFHDYKLALRKPGFLEDLGNETSLLEEKIALFKIHNASITVSAGNGTLVPEGSDTIYDVLNVYATSNDVYEKVNRERFGAIVSAGVNTKINPTFSNHCIWIRKAPTAIQIHPASGTDLKFDYIKKPSQPKFTTEMASGKAFKHSGTIDFQLHSSEMGAIVNRILELVGVMKGNPLVVQTAGKIEATNEVNKDR